jgi:hypothetical protein
VKTRRIGAAVIGLSVCVAGLGHAQAPRVILPPQDEADDNDTTAAGAVPRCDPGDRVVERVRVLLLDLKAPTNARQLASSLGQVIADEAARVPGFQMLSTAELRAILDNEAEKAMVGCSDSECMAEIASALDAELLISGNLDLREGSPPTLSLSLVNTRALVTVNRVTMSWPGDRDRLPEVARAAAQRLVFEGEMRKPGTVVFEGLPPDAHVVLDDVDHTDDLTDQSTLSLPVGPYRVRMTAEGHEPAEALVLVQAGQQSVVDGQLAAIEESMSTWWIWASGAAVATVLVVGIAAGVALTGASGVNASADVDVPTLSTVEGAP